MATVITPPEAERTGGAGTPPPDAPVGGEWARRYPPLVSLAVAFLIALVVLPSSLNVPQSNPSTTLEFAPVPPEDQDNPPPQTGNLSSLGLGSSSSLTEEPPPLTNEDGSLPSAQLPPPLPNGPSTGKSPRTKRCVGNPPRQTEDPAAPPCVADFSGDNGGATWQGVSGEEVNVLFYLQGFYIYTNTCRDPAQETPDGTYYDLAQPPKGPEHCLIRNLRVYQQYFNDRYQSYGRFVHFHVYVSGAGDSAEERKADAADNYAKVQPFAVISDAEDFNDEYLKAMAKRNVLVFDATSGRSEEFLAQYPGRIWNFLPSVQQQAKQFSSMMCTKVAGKPVSGHTNPAQNGKERVYGLYYTTDAGYPQFRLLKDLLLPQLEACGIKVSVSQTFPSAGYVQDNRYPPTYAERAVAAFAGANPPVTSIIWPSGLETQFSKAAARRGYQPELFIVGDGLIENRGATRNYQEASTWNNAWVMTNGTFIPSTQEQPCYVAYRETNPSGDEADAQTACDLYDRIRQLFIGIQVAGPRLTPQTMDQGFHAIPPQRSTDPTAAACFYEPGDYTCVKDAMLERWDQTGANGQGCYRMAENGARYFAGTWPEGNIDAQYRANATCNAYTKSSSTNPNPPTDPDNI